MTDNLTIQYPHISSSLGIRHFGPKTPISSGQAQAGEHHAPPVFPGALPQGDPQRAVPPGGQAEVPVIPGGEVHLGHLGGGGVIPPLLPPEQIGGIRRNYFPVQFPRTQGIHGIRHRCLQQHLFPDLYPVLPRFRVESDIGITNFDLLIVVTGREHTDKKHHQ